MSDPVSVNKSYFNSFPIVLLSSVMTYLDLSELFRVAQSCRTGRHASDLPLTWKGRVARELATPCPYNVIPNQHKANMAQLARIRGESVDASEREILQKATLSIQAEKVYKTIPRDLIAALGGFEAYQALPLLDLRGKKDHRGDPLSVHGNHLSQGKLVDERGVFCPVMRGFFEERKASGRHFQFEFEEPTEQRRFIAIAVDTKDKDDPCVRFVLYFFERAYSTSVAHQSENLGKGTTADLPLNCGLRSNMVQARDFATVKSILEGTHPLLTLATRE